MGQCNGVLHGALGTVVHVCEPLFFEHNVSLEVVYRGGQDCVSPPPGLILPFPGKIVGQPLKKHSTTLHRMGKQAPRIPPRIPPEAPERSLLKDVRLASRLLSGSLLPQKKKLTCVCCLVLFACFFACCFVVICLFVCSLLLLLICEVRAHACL